MTLATRTVTGVWHYYLAALSRRIRGRSVERSCPLRDVDRQARSFLATEWRNLCTKRLMLTFTIIPTTHKPPNRPNSWKATEVQTGLVGSSSLLLCHSHTNARSYTVPHYEPTPTKSRKVLNEPWDWSLVGEIE